MGWGEAISCPAPRSSHVSLQHCVDLCAEVCAVPGQTTEEEIEVVKVAPLEEPGGDGPDLVIGIVKAIRRCFIDRHRRQVKLTVPPADSRVDQHGFSRGIE